MNHPRDFGKDERPTEPRPQEPEDVLPFEIATLRTLSRKTLSAVVGRYFRGLRLSSLYPPEHIICHGIYVDKVLQAPLLHEGEEEPRPVPFAALLGVARLPMMTARPGATVSIELENLGPYDAFVLLALIGKC